MKKKIIKVECVWSFEFDADGYDPEFIDVYGLAIDSTKNEMSCLLKNKDISSDDFEYRILKGES